MNPETPVNAQDHIHVNQVAETILPRTTIENTHANSPYSSSRRVNQQRLLATSIQTRTLNEIITGSNTSPVSTTVSDSTSVTFTSTLTNNLNQQVMAIPDISIYIGITDVSQIAPDGSNQWPTSTVGGGNFPVYINPSDWGLSNGIDQVARVTCRNNTGSTQTVLLVVHWRVIAQPQTLGVTR